MEKKSVKGYKKKITLNKWRALDVNKKGTFWKADRKKSREINEKDKECEMCEYERISQKDGERKENKMKKKKKKETRLAEVEMEP